MLDPIYLPRSTDTHSRSIPTICIDNDGGTGNGTDYYRGLYSDKTY